MCTLSFTSHIINNNLSSATDNWLCTFTQSNSPHDFKHLYKIAPHSPALHNVVACPTSPYSSGPRDLTTFMEIQQSDQTEHNRTLQIFRANTRGIMEHENSPSSKLFHLSAEFPSILTSLCTWSPAQGIPAPLQTLPSVILPQPSISQGTASTLGKWIPSFRLSMSSPLP